MSPERFPPDDPREWLRRAGTNLAQAAAAAGHEGVAWEDLCFDCQQAAEKAMKGALLKLRGKFPKTHSIDELVRLILECGQKLPDDLIKASGLTEYATGTRYPGDYEPVTEEDYGEARQWAEAVLAWARQLIEKGGDS